MSAYMHSRIHSLIAGLALWMGCALMAQAAGDDARKSVINITTYDADGKLLKSGNGFYVGERGEAVALYDLFDGASKAVAIDANGKRHDVSRIIGASDTYDVVRFRVDTEKNDYLTPAPSQGTEGAAVEIVPYSVEKKSRPVAARISSVTTFESYSYYTLDTANEDQYAGCPVTDAAGQVVGIAQKNVTKDAAGLCAIDVRAATTLSAGTLGYISRDLKAIHIPTALPANETDALNYIYMLGMTRQDSMTHVTAYADFIAAYPANADIYLERAKFYASRHDYARSEADIAHVVDEFPDKAAEAHYVLGRIIYEKMTTAPQPPYADWSLEKALAESQAASQADNQPLYVMQAGECQFALKQYDKAYESFLAVTRTPLASSQVFYYAARALELAGGDSLQILALADSAVARCAKPYQHAAAPYLFARASYRVRYGLYREAVTDYNDYADIMGTSNLNAHFHYLREQAELKGHLYQQALDDIDAAIEKQPGEALYHMERAVIQVLVANYEEGLASAREAMRLAPKDPEGYRLAGLAEGELGRKAQARELLQKAKELGSASAETLIQRYAE